MTRLPKCAGSGRVVDQPAEEQGFYGDLIKPTPCVCPVCHCEVRVYASHRLGSRETLRYADHVYRGAPQDDLAWRRAASDWQETAHA